MNYEIQLTNGSWIITEKVDFSPENLSRNLNARSHWGKYILVEDTDGVTHLINTHRIEQVVEGRKPLKLVPPNDPPGTPVRRGGLL